MSGICTNWLSGPEGETLFHSLRGITESFLCVIIESEIHVGFMKWRTSAENDNGGSVQVSQV